MKTHIFLAILLLTGAFVVGGCQRGANSTQAAGESRNLESNHPISQADMDFLLATQKSNVKEQALTQMAMARSHNNEVKDFAKMLNEDHTKALEDVVALMDKKGVSHPMDLDDVRKEAEEEIHGMSDATFDRDFINMMVVNHEKGVATFKMQAKTALDDNVRDFAEDLLPTLEKHLEKAKELQSKLGRT